MYRKTALEMVMICITCNTWFISKILSTETEIRRKFFLKYTENSKAEKQKPSFVFRHCYHRLEVLENPEISQVDLLYLTVPIIRLSYLTND